MKWRSGVIAASCVAIVLFTHNTTLADDYAPSDLTTAQILARARAATGKLDPGMYVIAEHTHSASSDNYLTTRIHDKDSVTLSHFGPFTSSYGVYNGQRWDQDVNGVVLLGSDFHERVDPNANAWEHPEIPENHVKVLGITTTPAREYVVEANPPGGTDQYAYYDATTMHLVRVVTFARDRHKHVVTYDDFRTQFGRTRAYHIHYSNDLANDESDTWVTSVAQDPDPTPPTMPVSRALYAFPGNGPVQIPCTFTRYGIVIRATIGGRGVDLVLDSGSTDITLDPSITKQLGFPSYGKSTGTQGGDFDFSLVKIPQMQVGPLTLDDVQAETLAMNTDDGDGHRVVGLLGADFIAGGVLGIDFKKQTVTLYPRGSFDPAAVGVVGQAPIDVGDFIPRVQASVEAVPGNFLIDTGSFTTVLFKDYLGKLPHLGGSEGTVNGFVGVGGAVRARTFDVSDFILGPLRFETLEAVEPQSSIWGVRNYDGVIGRNVLSRYAIYLDYADRLVYFKPEL